MELDAQTIVEIVALVLALLGYGALGKRHVRKSGEKIRLSIDEKQDKP